MDARGHEILIFTEKMSATQICNGCVRSDGADPRRLFIGNATDLARLSLFQRCRIVSFNLPQFSPLENRQWAKAFEKAYTECGCTVGAYCLIGAIVVSALTFAIALTQPDHDLGKLLRLLALFTIGAVLVGKLSTIAFARLRIPKLVKTISKRLHTISLQSKTRH
jgi:hypothetical protein